MDHNQQVGKNFAWLSIAQFSVRLIGAGFYFFLSYRLREAGLGEYNFISSFVPLWFLFTDFGASSYLYREWAKQRTTKEEVARDFNILFSCCSVITLGVFLSFLGVNYFINREVFLPMVIFFVAMYVAGYVHLTDLNLQANNIFKQTSVRQIIEKVTVAVLGIILLMWHPQVYLLFVAIFISQVLSIFYYLYKRILIRFTFIWDWKRVFDLFKKGIPFMLIGLFTTIYAKIDMTMLRYMGGFSAVGLYGSAYKFLDISTLFSSLFAASTFPVLTSLYERYKMSTEFNDFFYRNLRIIFASSVLIAVFFIFTAPILFRVFFPSSFSPGILVLRILIISQVLVFFSLLFNNLLVVQNNEKKMLFIILSSALLNIVINIYLIPKYSFYGAAWATVIAEVFNLYLLQRFAIWQVNVSYLLKMFAVIIGNAGVLIVLRNYGLLNNLYIGAGILLINLMLLLGTKLIYWSDINLFISPIKNKLNFLWLQE